MIGVGANSLNAFRNCRVERTDPVSGSTSQILHPGLVAQIWSWSMATPCPPCLSLPPTSRNVFCPVLQTTAHVSVLAISNPPCVVSFTMLLSKARICLTAPLLSNQSTSATQPPSPPTYRCLPDQASDVTCSFNGDLQTICPDCSCSTNTREELELPTATKLLSSEMLCSTILSPDVKSWKQILV